MGDTFIIVDYYSKRYLTCAVHTYKDRKSNDRNKTKEEKDNDNNITRPK
jgi:hypothetical protein